MKQPLIFSLCALLATAPLFAGNGDMHAKKTEFKDAMTWPATAPGQVTLKAFQPFRAEYERRYKQGAGPKKGEQRVDRVIIVAENAGWDGRPTTAVTIMDSADPKYEDTNGRIFTQYFDRGTLELLYEMGPIPGKAKDYYILRALPDKLVGSMVVTDQGEAKKQTMPVAAPGFGAPAPWAMASMKLETGKKLRLHPAYSQGGGVMTTYAPARVAGREKIKALNGKTYKAWVLESVSNLRSPWMIRSYVIERPPYLIVRKSHNMDTGEERVYMNLRSFQTFDP